VRAFAGEASDEELDGAEAPSDSAEGYGEAASDGDDADMDADAEIDLEGLDEVSAE